MHAHRTCLLRPGLALLSLPLLSTCESLDPVEGLPSSCSPELEPGDVSFTELMANPSEASDRGHEWIELHNPTDRAVDLSGVVLASLRPGGPPREHVIHRLSVPPAGYVLLGDRSLPDESSSASVSPRLDYGYDRDLGALGNSEGTLELRCASRVLASVHYAAPRAGVALSRDGRSIGTTRPDVATEAWCHGGDAPGSPVEGTPGAPNAECPRADICTDEGDVRAVAGPEPDDLVINEFMADPRPTADADGEWVELSVRRTVDLNGLTVQRWGDPSDAAPEPSATIRAVACLTAQAGSHVLLAPRADAALNGGLPRVDAALELGLPNRAEGPTGIQLRWNGADVAHARWSRAEPGASWARQPDLRGSIDALADASPHYCLGRDTYGEGGRGSPGAPNPRCPTEVGPDECRQGETVRPIRRPRPGELVLAEVMPDPRSVDDAWGEWIELRAHQELDLNGVWVGRDRDSSSTLDAQACLTVSEGEVVLLARSADDEVNGGLPEVDAELPFSLPQRDGQLALGVGDAELDRFEWDESRPGTAWALEPGTSDHWCSATIPYGRGDLGSPGALNPACIQPSPRTTCLDDGGPRPPIVPEPGDVWISEVMPDPSAVPDATGEWFELVTARDVDLNGLQIGVSAGLSSAIASDRCLFVPAETPVVWARTDDPARNGGLTPIATFDVSLVNRDGELAIGYGDVVLDAVSWADARPGTSIQIDRTSAETTRCPGSRVYGSGDLGTPGEANACLPAPSDTPLCRDSSGLRDPVPPRRGDLAITEWMPDPDGDDASREWFEITALGSFDLNGVRLGSTSDDARPAFDEEACIRADRGDHVVFARRLDPEDNGGLQEVAATFSFSLTNGAGAIVVAYRDTVLDEVRWSATRSGQSLRVDPSATDPADNDDPSVICRSEDASWIYGPGGRGTPGAPNPPCATISDP